MAVKTTRRNPTQVDTDNYYDDLNEGYFNFTSFKGINSKQNYISIDQESFEDAKNVYLDQNAQLSTRPIVGKITILPNNQKIVKIIKINNVTFYHTVNDANTFYIYFYMANEWQEREVGEKLCITWIYDKYFVFTNNLIFAFSYDFDTNTINWYDAKDVLYVPTIVEGPESQDKNIFTDSENLQYTFQYGVSINVDRLIGNEVTVTIDEETFNITFVLNNDKVFTKQIYELSNATMYVARDRGNIIAKTTTNDTSLYYSPDGYMFQTIPFPDFPQGRSYIYTISDDGLELYFTCTSDNGENPIVYYMTLTEDFQVTSWVKIETNILSSLSFTSNHYVKRDTGSSESNLYDDDSEGINGCQKVQNLNCSPVLIHSPEVGKFAILCQSYGRAYYYRDWTYLRNGNIYDYDEDIEYSYKEVNPLPNDIGYSCYTILVYEKSGSSWNAHISTGIHKFTVTSSWRNFKSMVYNYVGKFIQFNSDENLYTVQLDNNYIAKGKIIAREDEFFSGGSSDPTYLYINIYKDVWFIQSLSDFKFPDNKSFRVIYNNGNLLTNIAGYRQTANQDCILNNTLSNIKDIDNYNASDYAWTYTYDGHGRTLSQGVREDFPWTADLQSTFTVINEGSISKYFVMDFDKNVLTDTYFYYQSSKIPLLQRKSEDNEVYEIIPLYIDYSEKYILYYSNSKLYSSNYTGTIVVTSSSSGTINFLIPDKIVNFIGATNINVFNINNKLYWTSSEGTPGQLYVPESNVVELADKITNFAVFSQTSLGVFLEDSVYEFMYDTSNSVYRLAPTKLQLGCKKDADVLVSYDGSTIFLSTIKGLSGLTYQDFVQSTEQVYSYLTDNILDMYDEYYEGGPIKLYQYKYWLFMYRDDSTIAYVYDTRNQSWWKWEFVYPIQQIVYTNDKLIVLMNNTTYNMYDDNTIYDDGVFPFDWYILSQKLHFNAPNYYKHIKQLAIITSQDSSKMRYKLCFKNYRNLNNLVDSDTVEYQIEQLNTLIKRVSFMKTNAFQFCIRKDDTDKHPSPFVVPDIAVKYRITEATR